MMQTIGAAAAMSTGTLLGAMGSGLLVAVLAYLLGSLSFAILVTKLVYHKDIHAYGSGNAGMTNVLRTFGKGAAALTLAGDVGKGVLAVVLGKWLFPALTGLPAMWGAGIAWVFVVLGHIYPVYFHFKGGKAVSVGAGAMLGVHPVMLLPVMAAFLLVFLCGRMVSLASLCAAVVYPISAFVFSRFVFAEPAAVPTVCAAIVSALAVWKHRSNIQRLKEGTEYKFERHAKK